MARDTPQVQNGTLTIIQASQRGSTWHDWIAPQRCFASNFSPTIHLSTMVTLWLEAGTIIRSLLVSATMCLPGRWNWWLPGRALPPKQGDERHQ